jgi:hypothetical protein
VVPGLRLESASTAGLDAGAPQPVPYE